MVREDYYRKTQLTYQEAALVSGLAAKTIQNLKSRRRISGNLRGKFKVDHESLLHYLQGK